MVSLDHHENREEINKANGVGTFLIVRSDCVRLIRLQQIGSVVLLAFRV
jgi:hypothetical protein